MNAVIGAGPGVSGFTSEVAVAGTGATWMNSGTLTVGKGGPGRLSISTGGGVSSKDAIVGDAAGSNGQVFLTDPGSLWQINGNLTIGATGTGAVTLDSGAKLNITGRSLVLGRDTTGDGTLILNDPTSVFGFTGPIQIGLDGTGKLALGKGFKIDQGAGPLTLGERATATGTLQVSDASSKFSTTGPLTIGSLGTGHVIVQTGGALASGAVILGDQPKSTGDAIVRDPNSSWDITGDLTIGNFGMGHVTVKDGGTLALQAGNTITLGQQKDSEGTLTLDGLGAKILPQAALDGVVIGAEGNGTLEIKNGATASLKGVTLGQQLGSSGTISVDGAAGGTILEPGTPSMLTLTGGVLFVGQKGSGFLDITGGGVVTLKNGNPVSDLKNVGLVIGGEGATGAGTATISGDGSRLDATGVSVEVAGTDDGKGQFNLSNNATANVEILQVGSTGGGTGAVRIDGTATGAGTTLAIADHLNIQAGGAVSITNGGRLVPNVMGSGTDDNVIGVAKGNAGNATLSVDGHGSTVHLQRSVRVIGNGSVTVTGGGTFNADSGLSIGSDDKDAPASVGINGANSKLTAGPGDVASVTVSGAGSLTIEAGATATVNSEADGLAILNNARGAGAGSVTVKGNGSSLELNGSFLQVGGFLGSSTAPATLRVSDGASITGVNSLIVGAFPAGTGGGPGSGAVFLSGGAKLSVAGDPLGLPPSAQVSGRLARWISTAPHWKHKFCLSVATAGQGQFRWKTGV